MRYAAISMLLFACSCGFVLARGGGGGGGGSHVQYRPGTAPRSQFKVGGRTYTINPERKDTKQIRDLKSEEFDPTLRGHRVEIFYRTKFKDHYEEFHRHLGHDFGPFRSEFVEWTRHWPTAMRARWAWHNRDYIDGPLWTEWMADPAFAAIVTSLDNGNVPAEAGYLPTEYAKISPLFVYNDAFLNAAFNPIPFLAVMKLKSLKPDEQTDWIGTASADSLISKLSSIPGLFLAEQDQVTGVLRDKKLKEPDALEPKTAAEVGKALDVEEVVVGSYVVDGDKVLFNLRIVDVKTGAVQTGISHTVARDHLLDEMPGLATSLADALGFKPQEESKATDATETIPLATDQQTAASLTFVPLFDGKSLDGWTGDKSIWSVHNGAIVGRMRRGDPKIRSYFSTEASYRNFVLTARFRVQSGDTGILFRGKPNTMFGLQVLVGTAKPGGFFDESPCEHQEKARWMVDDGTLAAIFKQNQWNDIRITANGDDFQCEVNGRSVFKTTYAEGPQAGVVSLKVKLTPKSYQDTIVAYKDIKIARLPD